MIRLRLFAILLCLGAFPGFSFAQKPTPAKANSESSELLELARNIDQQNIKIDLLSQQILRLQQQIEHVKPGTLSEGASAHEPPSAAPAAASNGNTHVVQKGETLTSIAHMHKATVSDLQKLNHIQDDRKLQIGQTLILPGGAASPSPSPSP
jgi:LysM repeat protein